MDKCTYCLRLSSAVYGSNFWCCLGCARNRVHTNHCDKSQKAKVTVNEDDLAYDGSNRPQERELTARERDILCRIITDRISEDKSMINSTIPEFLKNLDDVTELMANLVKIRKVIDPRES